MLELKDKINNIEAETEKDGTGKKVVRFDDRDNVLSLTKTSMKQPEELSLTNDAK